MVKLGLWQSKLRIKRNRGSKHGTHTCVSTCSRCLKGTGWGVTGELLVSPDPPGPTAS